MTAGVLTGSSAVNVSGATNWSGGSMSGTGATNANGGVALSGTATKGLTRLFRNYGNAT
jgi:hypothetical protein